MKLAIFVIVIVLGVVSSELCYHDGKSCAEEQCGAGQVPTCISFICTCNPAPAATSCNLVSDCDKSNYWDAHHCKDNSRHCIDQTCVCRRF